MRDHAVTREAIEGAEMAKNIVTDQVHKGSWYSFPLKLLNEARAAVPAVDWALGVAGIASAGALVVGLLGYGRATVLILGGMFVAMVLLLLFSRMVGAKDFVSKVAGWILLVAVTLFACAFLLFTVTAFVNRWPEPWAQVLGITAKLDKPPSGFVRFFGPLSHLEEAIKISEAKFTVTLSEEQISRFYVSDMRAANWKEWFSKFCDLYNCLSCRPDPKSVTTNLRISLSGKLRQIEEEGQSYVACYK